MIEYILHILKSSTEFRYKKHNFCIIRFYEIAKMEQHLRGLVMCDVNKYRGIFEEIKKLDPDDTLQLVLESKTEEEKNFYEMIGDFLLQERQKESIARNVF